ncbi:MAG: hypothetical protein O7G85_12120 [Planctomycetota bacterium]|nr:hypothetical protein [Planctomycetota bacterium]
MPHPDASCPMTYEQAIEAYFMEHRAKLIDVAAFLDRLERTSENKSDDFRMIAFRSALEVLGDGEPDRARRLLELFSDFSTEPIDTAPMKGALGAMPLDPS